MDKKRLRIKLLKNVLKNYERKCSLDLLTVKKYILSSSEKAKTEYEKDYILNLLNYLDIDNLHFDYDFDFISDRHKHIETAEYMDCILPDMVGYWHEWDKSQSLDLIGVLNDGREWWTDYFEKESNETLLPFEKYKEKILCAFLVRCIEKILKGSLKHRLQA